MKQDNPTIEAAWKSFEAKVVPSDAGRVQRLEMRRSFYAGAVTTLALVQEIGNDAVSERAGVAMLERLHSEARAYALMLKCGAA